MAVVVATVIVVSGIGNPIFVNQQISGGNSVVESMVEDKSFLESKYSKVIESYKQNTYNGKPIIYDTADATENLKYMTKEEQGYHLSKVLNLQAGVEVTLTINVPEEGTYCVTFDYNAYNF